MSITKRVLKFIALVAAAVLLISIAAYYLFGEYVVQVAIETSATKALGVGVDINDTDTLIFKGALEIRGLTVRNPAGYTHTNLIELDTGHISVNFGSLFGDTVDIKKIRLDGLNLVIEQKGLSNNLLEVRNSISSRRSQKPQPPGKKLRIDELEITNIRAKVKLLPVPGRADTVVLKLAPIKMRNLGTDSKVGTGLLASRIILAISDSIAGQASGVLPMDLVNTFKLTLDESINLGKVASKGAKKLIEEGKDVGEGIIEEFKGLLKPEPDK